MEREEPSSIIIRMPNWLGDVVMATPVIEAVRNRWPRAHICVMISKSLAPLLERDPHINEIFAFSKPKGFLRRLEDAQILEKLREGNYDLGILLTNSFSSAWWFYRGGVQKTIGFGRRWLLNKSVALPKNYKNQHLVHSYLQLLQPLGIPFKEKAPQLFLTRQEQSLAVERIRGLGGGLVIGMNPGAAFGPAKCWPAEKFRALTKKLLEKEKVLLLFFGEQSASPLIDGIIKGIPSRVVNLAGKTHLREFMAMVGACNLFITNDSGPMHVAAALQVPLIALFGSTSDVMTGPYKFGRVIHKRVSCSPCFLRECPLDFKCMQEIAVEDVTKIVEALNVGGI